MIHECEKCYTLWNDETVKECHICANGWHNKMMKKKNKRKRQNVKFKKKKL